jgi:hypothetical protein
VEAVSAETEHPPLLKEIAMSIRSMLETFESRRHFSGGPTLTISDTSIVEGNAATQNAAIVVSLSAPSSKTVSANYSTTDGTATAGSDYNAVSGKLAFAPGETSKVLLIPIRGDLLPEPDETIVVRLSGVKNATPVKAQGAVSIMDNEPRIRIGYAGAVEPDLGGTGLAEFIVSLSAPCDTPVTVNYATADATATTYGQDYVATSGTLTFAPGEVSKAITVTIIGDNNPEPDEMFSMNLSAASPNVFTAVGQGFCSIYANDYWTEDPYQWWADW